MLWQVTGRRLKSSCAAHARHLCGLSFLAGDAFCGRSVGATRWWCSGVLAPDSVTNTRLSDSVTVAFKSLPCIGLSCHDHAAQVGQFVTLRLLLLLVPREFEVSLSA